MIPVLLLLAVLAISAAASLALGEIAIPVPELWCALVAPDMARPHVVTILWDLRLPRTALAALVGAALAAAGTVTQAIVRNPLAEPGILGINAGAALVATLVIVGRTQVSELWLPVFSFAGALAMSAAVFALAWREGTNSLRIILIGIGLSALAGAGATFVSTFGDIPSIQRAMTWLSGSLQDGRWIKSAVLALWFVPAFAAAWLLSRDLDLLRYGDGVARGRGQRVDLVRGGMILASAAIAGAAVAAAGLVAFVGLVAPHIARSLAGHGHARLLPAAALVGAIIVVLADLGARRAFAPVVLPVGLMTGILGTPFFAWLFWTRRNG